MTEAPPAFICLLSLCMSYEILECPPLWSTDSYLPSLSLLSLSPDGLLSGSPPVPTHAHGTGLLNCLHCSLMSRWTLVSPKLGWYFSWDVVLCWVPSWVEEPIKSVLSLSLTLTWVSKEDWPTAPLVLTNRKGWMGSNRVWASNRSSYSGVPSSALCLANNAWVANAWGDPTSTVAQKTVLMFGYFGETDLA